MPDRSLETEQTFDALASKALEDGTVRVIVGLRTNFEPEGELPSRSAAKTQRARLAVAQDALLGELPGLRPESVKRFEFVPYLAFEADAAAVERLRTSPNVAAVFEDVPVAPMLSESTPLIGATAAWSAGFSGSGQAVAILDTGVDKTHPFLSGKVVSEACFSTNSSSQNTSSLCPGGAAQTTATGSGLNCTLTLEGCEHGTHVAGIAAGRGPNFSGVARDANIIAIKVFTRFNRASDCDGFAPCILAFESDIMKGLERVFALRDSIPAASANLSLGGGQFSSNCDSDPRKAIIDNLRSVGIATVIAAGNESFKDSLSTPACISSAISVGSTGDGSGSTRLNLVSSFSNSASFLNLLAPGDLIRSSVPGGSFANFSGTSMAAPHVAGAWAVLKSKNPSATVAEVYTALRDTGLPVTDVNGITKPRIKIDAALAALGGGGPGGCPAPVHLSAGQTISGELSQTDCRLPAGGEHFSDAYTFAGTAGQQVSIQLSSNAFDTLLHLAGPGGAEVASDDDGGGGTNSRIPAGTGFYMLPADGTYTIQATSFTSNTSGTYTLNLTAQTPGGCTTPTPISFGQTVSGTLADNDCRLTDGSLFDEYSFDGVAGQQVSVSMSASAFDAFLVLFNPDGTTLATNNNGGGGSNSRIPAGGGQITLPTTGTYTIYANSFAAGATGGYTLTLDGQSPGGGCPSTPVSVGQTVSGTLTVADCRLSDGSFFDSYSFSGVAGQEVFVSLRSSTFDTYLLLLNPDGSLLSEDDDGGGGSNSRIPAGGGTLSLPSTGTYRILANSFEPNVTGAYSLTLAGPTPSTCASSPITFGQTVSGTLANTDCLLSDGSFFDSYAFEGATGQQVAVALASTNFDTYLFLTGPNGLVVDDDDGGSGLNSRIPAGTGFFTLPSAGTYTILANSFAPNATGDYSLSLTSSQPGCSYTIGTAEQSFGPGGGAGSLAVAAGAGCGWAAASNAGWITLTSPTQGSGAGVVTFAVAPNNTAESRTGTLTAAGRTFTVVEAADTNSTVQFAAASIAVNESDGKVQFEVSRTGSTAVAATVSYKTTDGTADRRGDYTEALATLAFGVGETSKTITVFITDDVYTEPPESFNVTLLNPTGATLGGPGTLNVTINSEDSADGPNPLDVASFNAQYFVRQHYVDFLNREPDPSGLAFWTGEIESCGADAGCREVKRINVSAAFFLSIEFQETGYFVERMYKAAYGDATSPGVAGNVPVLRFEEFLPDTQRIGRGVVVGQGDWQARLEANKQAYALEFVKRQRYTGAFPLSLTPAEFVARLDQNAGGVLSQTERAQLVEELAADYTSTGRAAALRKITDDQDLRQKELNRAFVLMQYYGYLRRNPDDPRDADFGGWKFWLSKLNEFNGNYVRAEMVKAFLDSNEYRGRFGPP
ncbi:MAG: S8 family serine peptidase [Pyrinomonadaceae bacterium]